jgi:hypothetical protein
MAAHNACVNLIFAAMTFNKSGHAETQTAIEDIV